MRLYWQERRSGERLILLADDESETEVGAVRHTPRGFDALAMTNTYDPGRAQKGFATIEEAKAFVEEFHPWDLFGGDIDMEVEPEVRRLPAESSSGPEDTAPGPTTSGESSARGEEKISETIDRPVAETASADESGAGEAQGDNPKKGSWQFWKRG